MAKVPLQKIRVTGLKNHYKILMQELHRKGILQVVENEEFVKQSVNQVDEHFGVFDLARIDFALQFLSPYEKAQSKIETLLSGGKLVTTEEEAKRRLEAFSGKYEGIIEECEKLENGLVKAQNELQKIPAKQALVQNILGLGTTLSIDFDTKETQTWVGKVLANQAQDFSAEIAGESNLIDINTLSRDKKYTFFRITTLQRLAEKTEHIFHKFHFEPLDLNLELQDFMGKTTEVAVSDLHQQEIDLMARIKKYKTRAKDLAKYINDLRILFDYNSWRKKKNDLQHKIFRSEKVFAFEAWVPKGDFKDLERWLKHVFVGEVSLEKIHKSKEEAEPIFIQNKPVVSSFESVTEMHGLPKKTEFDPTIFLAPFFFVFFGLCLSDVGYGMILFLVSAWFMLFGKFEKTAKDSLFLLVLCGGAAILGGVALGGYFGMTPDQAPYLVNPETGKFYGQLLDPMAGSGPIIFLLLSLGLGIFQLMVGELIGMAQRIKNKEALEGFAGNFLTVIFLLSLLGFALADQLGLDKPLTKTILTGAFGALYVGQCFIMGRGGNIFLMPLMGLAGIYNVITGYLSDVLSYARIMALGLATGVVGFAMNMTAGILGDMMPYPILGVALAIFVILFGHILNFSLSLLGAFIHSGRLQFIEFFGKFYEGGGNKFTPFAREKRYIFFRS